MKTTCASTTEPVRRRGAARRWLCLAIVVLALGLAWQRQACLTAVAKWLDVGSPPTRVDYIVPLPAEPTTRPFIAAAWVRTGLARQVWVMYHAPSEIDAALPYRFDGGGLTLQVLKKRGLTDDQILVIPSQAESTRGDAELIAERLAAEPNATLAIVTTDYHTRRTRWTFNRYLGHLANRLIFISAPGDEFTAENWWYTGSGFATYMTEYCKLAAYWMMYGNGVWWGAAVGLLAVAIFGRRRRRKLAL